MKFNDDGCRGGSGVSAEGSADVFVSGATTFTVGRKSDAENPVYIEVGGGNGGRG